MTDRIIRELRARRMTVEEMDECADWLSRMSQKTQTHAPQERDALPGEDKSPTDLGEPE